MTSGDELLKKIYLARHVQWQYQLENYNVESIKFITKSLDKARNELFNELSLRDFRLPPGRDDKVLSELNDLTFGIQAQLTGNITEAAEIAGRASLKEYGQIMSFNGRLADTVGFNFVSLSAEQLRSMVVDTPVGGKLLKNWVADNFKRQVVDEIQIDIMAGRFKGETTKKLVNRLRDSFNILNHEAITLTRTYVASMNNRSAELVYKANSDIITKEEWNATLEVSTRSGRGTCFQCAALDGEQWPLESDHPRPLAHPRCRCFMLPVTKSYRELGLNIDELKKAARPFTVRNGIPINDGRGKSILDFGVFEGNAQDFIKKQGPVYLKNVVGPRRKALLDAGKIDFKDLVDRNGNVILLKNLPKLDKPLKVYRKPSNTPKTLKKSLLEAETKIYSRKTEKAYIFDPDGNKIFSKPGGKSSVSFTLEEVGRMRNNILTHNHPTYGSSFSKADISLLVQRDLKEIRAVGKEYVHSFSLTEGAPGKNGAQKLIFAEFNRADQIVRKDFITKLQREEITIEYAEKNHHHLVWSKVNDQIDWVKYWRKKWKPLK